MMKYFYLLLISIFAINCNQKDHLSEMNNISMPNFEELKYYCNSSDTLKILITGNSITSHGISEDIGWLHKSGMAASDIKNDYVHLLFDKVKKDNLHKNIILRYSNWSVFERNPETFKGFDQAQKFNPNILIFQLSDNISPESQGNFQKLSVNFLTKFKTKIVVSPFFMSNLNYKISKDIANASNSYFVDISNISNNKINRASNDLHNDKSKWKSEGIGAHPGNTGMINISNAIHQSITALEH